ncbi:MAG: rhodanese-like domain-containing protein [Marinoscillum sp.]
MMKYLWILLVAISCGRATQAQEYKTITNDELVGLLSNEDLQLIDVRTPEEVAVGVIEGAKHIDIYDPEFVSKIDQLDKSRPVAVYCAAGGRSAKASDQFKKLGFMQVYDLSGGYRGWVAAGKETVKLK